MKGRAGILAAAAVVVAAATAGGLYLATSSSHHPKSVLSLKLPNAGRHGVTTCIRFDTELLAKQKIAFSGTVASTADNTVKLSVDHWYKGGTADEVDLTTPTGVFARTEFGVHFHDGHRYLVSANGGTVTGCGYSGAYSAQLAADFAKAFG